MLARLLASPALIYVKLVLLAILVAGAGYAAWSIRGAYADREKEEAVNAAVASIQKDLDTERLLRGQYETLADTRLTALMKSISKLQTDFKAVSGSIAEERKNNPAFYNQPLPDKGYEQWKRARALLGSQQQP